MLGSLSRKDGIVLTPHKVAIILFLERYGSFFPNVWGMDDEDENADLDMTRPNFSTKERTSMCLLVATLMQGSDLQLSKFVKLLDSYDIPAAQLALFYDGLQKIYISGIDSFLNLFDSVAKFSSQDQARIDSYPCLWTSLVGLYLRQLSISFRKLNFSCVVNLYQRFRSYYELYKADNKRNVIESVEDSDVNMTNVENEVCMSQSAIDMNPCNSDHFRFNQYKISVMSEKMIEFSPLPNQQLNKKVEIGSRQQAELFIDEQISLLLMQDSKAMAPPKLQEICRTLLKSCPDLGKVHFLSYMNMLRLKEYTGALHSLVRAYDSKIMQKESARIEDITKTSRYAALNMAALQANFGHTELGMLSLKEAIRLSQESNDGICLQYALAWLYTIYPSHKANLMKRSYTRSNEMNLGYLSWLSLLNYTVESAQSTKSPTDLLQKIMFGMFPNKHQEKKTSMGCMNGQSGMWSVQAALWALWGNSFMVSICSQLVLHLRPQMSTNFFSLSTVSPTCAALCNMAQVLAHMAEYNFASEILRFAQRQFPPPLWDHSKHWLFTQARIGFNEALYMGRWEQAESMVVSMATTQSLQSKVLEAQLLVAKEEYGKALKCVEVLQAENEANEEFSSDLKMKCLLIKAESQAAGNNLGSALSTLANAVSFADSHHLVYLSSLASLQLASVQMHLNLMTEAERSFYRGANVVLSGGGIYDQSRVMLLLAKLKVRSSKDDRTLDLINAAKILSENQPGFAKVKAYSRLKETLYLKARFYHEGDKIEDRNKSAFEFKQLEQQQPNCLSVMSTTIF